MTTQQDYNSRIVPTWCPGCGNFGVWSALKNAFTRLNFTKDDVCMVYDVGCSSNMADFLSTYGIHGLHGRAISTAIGVHLAHHQFPVVAIGGDGGLYGEGVEHFIEAVRGNFNITAIVYNNRLYSLTTGQRSPVAFQGAKTKSTPFGVIEIPFQPLKTAVLHDAGFVARGFAVDPQQLTDLIEAAIKHKGFSLVEVLQPCPSFNKDMDVAWYKERIHKLENGNGLSKDEALKVLDEEPEKLATGVIYKSNRPAYSSFLPQLKTTPLLNQSIEMIDIGELVASFK